MNHRSRSVVPVFDLESTLERLMQNRQLLRCAVGAFMEQSPRIMAELGCATLQADAHGVGSRAHLLRGSALTVGAEQVAAIAGAMEQAASLGDVSEAIARLPALALAFVRFKRQIEQELD